MPRFLGKIVANEDAVTYAPVIALFAMAAAMALATSWASYGSVITVAAAEWFIAWSMCLLALQKLKDVDSFATMFFNCDLLAQRWVRYGYVYPFAERSAGVLMVSGALMDLDPGCVLHRHGGGGFGIQGGLCGPARAEMRLRWRRYQCAAGVCVADRNLMMIGMAIWMLTKPAGVGIGF